MYQDKRTAIVMDSQGKILKRETIDTIVLEPKELEEAEIEAILEDSLTVKTGSRIFDAYADYVRSLEF